MATKKKAEEKVPVITIQLLNGDQHEIAVSDITQQLAAIRQHGGVFTEDSTTKFWIPFHSILRIKY